MRSLDLEFGLHRQGAFIEIAPSSYIGHIVT